MAVPSSLPSTWLPTQRTAISVDLEGESLNASMGDLGKISSRRLKNEAGETMTMQNTGFVMAFQFENQTADFAPSDGTQWSDPDMPRQFDGKSGVVGQINWSGE